EQLRDVDRQRRVLQRRQTAVVVGDGRQRLPVRSRGIVDVDPVVARGVSSGRERVRGAVGVDAGVGGGAKVAAGETGVEIVGVVRIFAYVGVISGDIGRARCYRHRRGEIDFLPTARRFVGERRGSEQRTGRAPQIADMDAGIAGTLVEANAVDFAVGVGGEFHPQFDGA